MGETLEDVRYDDCRILTLSDWNLGIAIACNKNLLVGECHLHFGNKSEDVKEHTYLEFVDWIAG